ncbi:hypothetical protein SALBM311S_12025 [Streptomyces alboniger]
MTTNTNTATSTTPKAPHATPLIPLPPTAARAITVAGSATALVGTFLAWTWTEEFPGNLTVTGYPGGLQILTLVGAILTLLFTLSGQGIRGTELVHPRRHQQPRPASLTLGVLGTTGYSMGAISDELGGLVNLEPGAWVSGIGSLIAAIGAFGLPADQPYDDNDPHTRPVGQDPPHPRLPPEPSRAKDLPSWAEILIIAAGFGAGLYVFAYGIGTEYSELFIGFLIIAAFGFTALTRAGLLKRLSRLTAKHRNVTLYGSLRRRDLLPLYPGQRPVRLSSARTSSSSPPSPSASTSSSDSPASSTSDTSPSSASAPTPPPWAPAHPSRPSASTSRSGQKSSPEPSRH